MFSSEEINLMCIFDTSSREILIAELLESLNDVYDPDMREVFESTIEKLERISDEGFAEIGFCIADEYDGREDWYIAE
jgi:hypothetical protein